MKLLLDTHIILWTLSDDPKLSSFARNLITDIDNEIFYSTASTWELTIKNMARPDKIKIDGIKMAEGCRQMGFMMLPIMDSHVGKIRSLVYHNKINDHKDPFDRILIAQAKAENMHLITHDSKIPYYEESCIVSV